MKNGPIITCDGEAARRNAAIVQRFFTEVLSDAGSGVADAFLAEDFVDHDPEPGSDPGRHGVALKLAALFAAFPDGRFEPQIIVASGDMVAVRSRFTGTQAGAFGPLPASGRAVEVTFHDFYAMRDGRIAGHWHVFDAAGMMQQLGAAST